MFLKSPYLNHLPVLSLQPQEASNYQLRRSTRDDHLCTSEVAALCLALAGDTQAAHMLDAYLAVFSQHYLLARAHLPLNLQDAAHPRLRQCAAPLTVAVD
jgi:DTW domain-containing protein YfiP